jgi:hypothetical protein
MEFKRCEHCGASMQVYRWAFAKRFLRGLRKLYNYGGPAKSADLDLAFSEHNHFHFLAYWGLIQEIDDHIWQITSKGYQFLNNQISIPKYIWIFRGKLTAPPEDDDTHQEDIFANDVELELVNKEKALENSSPYIP